ncbi:MAG: DUF3568 family protein [Phycisphaerales bacterium]|nr:MAG: DUF3568 family protein [Phycisphaerales bacterium]
MRATKRLLGALTLGAALATGVSGCVAVAAAGAATAGVLYVRGELRSTVNADVPAVVESAERAVNEMGFSLVSAASDEAEGEVIARTARDRRVQIRVRSEGDNVSRYTIRVGSFGDEALSRTIDENIRAGL